MATLSMRNALAAALGLAAARAAFEIRLVDQYGAVMDGSVSQTGRLEVRNPPSSTTWGTVCDDYWGFYWRNADIACDELFGTAAVSYDDYAPEFEAVSNSVPIYMDDVACEGTEPSLSLCAASAWGSENCNHYEDIHLTCEAVAAVVAAPTPAPTPSPTVGCSRTIKVGTFDDGDGLAADGGFEIGWSLVDIDVSFVADESDCNNAVNCVNGGTCAWVFGSGAELSTTETRCESLGAASGCFRDGWAYGSVVLHGGDEAADRAYVQDGVSLSTGWFPLECTDVPSVEQLSKLQDALGGSGGLKPPDSWEEVKDPLVAQYFPLRDGEERHVRRRGHGGLPELAVEDAPLAEAGPRAELHQGHELVGAARHGLVAAVLAAGPAVERADLDRLHDGDGALEHEVDVVRRVVLLDDEGPGLEVDAPHEPAQARQPALGPVAEHGHGLQAPERAALLRVLVRLHDLVVVRLPQLQQLRRRRARDAGRVPRRRAGAQRRLAEGVAHLERREVLAVLLDVRGAGDDDVEREAHLALRDDVLALVEPP